MRAHGFSLFWFPWPCKDKFYGFFFLLLQQICWNTWSTPVHSPSSPCQRFGPLPFHWNKPPVHKGGDQVQQFASKWKSYPARVSPAVLFDQEDCRISRVTNKVVVWLWIHICDTRNIWSKKIETTVVYDEYFSFPPHCDVTAEHFVCCRGWKIMCHIDKEALKLNYNASPHLVSILVKKKTHPSGILDSIKQWTFTLRFIPEFR